MAILDKKQGKVVDLTLEQGATTTVSVKLTNKATALPIDITAYDVRAMIRENFADVTPIIAFTVTITDAVNGELVFTLTANQTEALTITSTRRERQIGYWDLEIESPGGIVTRVLEGLVFLSQEATK